MKTRAYACPVCQWQGAAEPTEPGDGALCENCGCLLYPRSFGETWGVVLLIVASVLVLVALVAYF